MEFILISAIMIFAVYGVSVVAKRLCARVLCGAYENDKILIYVKSKEERIEAVVRSLMINNPGAEIIVVDEGKSENMRIILDKLTAECARIHIKRKS